MRQPSFVVCLICAVFAAQISFAAVPVEESIEEARNGVEQVQPIAEPRVEPRPSQRARSLDIPPTIEPTLHSDYPAQQPANVSPRATTSPVANAGNQSQLAELFYQLQILQAEIQDLRGQVEEQTYLVKRLQRDQKEQYLDLDRRLVAFSENQPAPGPSSTAPLIAPIARLGDLTEREAYTQAFEAMRARDFDNSMAGFQSLIETYPNGQFTPNAYYWIGELQLVAKADAEQARQSFMQVVKLYPDHQKAPDALYKLGVVYHNLGDIPTAKSYLQRVQQEHPSSSAAGLAAKYAAELQ